MNKFFKTVIVGAVSGFAAAYFLSTEKGKEIKERATKAYEAYKENPDEYHQKAKEKTAEYTNLATDTFNDYKERFESGELTVDDVLATVKTKGEDALSFIAEKVSEITENQKPNDDVTVDADFDIKEDNTEEDIIIDYPSSESKDTETDSSDEV